MSLLRWARVNDRLIVNGPYPTGVIDVQDYRADDRGQPRLLVRHRNVAGTPYDQLSLLVWEAGTWRLAERPDLVDSPCPPHRPPRRRMFGR